MRKYLKIIIALLLIMPGWGGVTIWAGEGADDTNSAGSVSPYQARGWLVRSLPELADALREGQVSSELLVKAYIKRIKAIDWAGPHLQSVISLNPDAIAEARALDHRREAGQSLGPLHGVPILLKDIIESKDVLATTAGALALKDNVTGRDSPLVKGLRDAGAIILGKANLSQWANFRSKTSMSGWTALGGQVRNPHILDRNPCGSSSGSAVAMAASLAGGTVGTETNGSIICPSNASGIVGFKPTVGLVSQQYIVPISSTQDTAGPMTKTVRGAAMMLGAMATGTARQDYVGRLDKEKLKGARIGVLRFAQGSNPHVIRLFNAALKDLEAAGAILVDIEKFETDAEKFWKLSGEVLRYEFKATLNDYLAHAAPQVKVRNLSELIAFNKAHSDVELALFDQSLFDEAVAYGPLSDEKYQTALKTVLSSTREKGIDALMGQYNLDVLVSPSGPVPGPVDPLNGDLWPAWAGAGWMAAIAGYPHLSVPMGMSHGMPSNISFIGGKDQDAEILAYGYAYEQRTQKRRAPRYLSTAGDRPEISRAMKRK